jgi:hypothetical protein
MVDRVNCRTATLARAFRNHIRLLIDLSRLFIEHQVNVAKIRARNVPMKILGLDIEHEEVGEQLRQSRGNLIALHAPQITLESSGGPCGVLCPWRWYRKLSRAAKSPRVFAPLSPPLVWRNAARL